VKHSYLPFCLLLLSGWPGRLSAAPPLQGAVQEAITRPIKVVCDEDYPPYAFRDAEGLLEGIVVDQWKAWERVTGRRVELTGLPWQKAIERFESGAADVLDTVFQTPERRERYEFTDAYARLDVPVFTHTSLSGIASVEDLRGLKVGVKEGDSSIGQLAGRGVQGLVLYRSYQEIVEAATRLDLRVFCVDKPPAIYWLYKLGADRDFRIAFSLEGGAFHRAVLKGRGELLAEVKSGFAALRRSELAAIDRKWLGSEIERIIDSRAVWAAVATVFAIIFTLLAVSWILRRKVSAATAELNEKVLLLQQGEARIKASLDEKDILLKEIHHRVKNNLQIISSLLRLQSYALRDASDREFFEETQQRVHAMAQLHEMLYRSPDLASIDAGEYLRALVETLAVGASGVCVPRLELSSCRLDLDEAVPLGLIVNELVTNALKYGCPDGGRCEDRAGAADREALISVEFAQRGDRLALVVADRGPGLPGGLDPMTAATMGFTLVRSLTEQLKGEISFSGPPGLAVSLLFPIHPGRPAPSRPIPGA